MEPRSSRLKDKKKGEGELLVKDLFVQDVMQNNNLLHMLTEGSSVVILPANSLGTCANLKSGPEFQSRFSGVCSPDLAMKTTDALGLSSQVKSVKGEGARASWGDRLSEQGLFSCVTCGILCFACVAIVQPTDAAAHNLITADCSTFKDWEESNDATEASLSGDENLKGRMNKRNADGLFDVPVQAAEQIAVPDGEDVDLISNREAQKNTSSLGLLALAYGNSSDSEEDEAEATICIDSNAKCITDLPHSAVSGDQEAVSYGDISNSESRHQTELQLDTSSCVSATHKAETTMTTPPFPGSSDEDSSRKHVFCLQHAMQVEKKLRSVGGAHIFLLCHPGYSLSQPVLYLAKNRNIKRTVLPPCLTHPLYRETAIRAIYS